MINQIPNNALLWCQTAIRGELVSKNVVSTAQNAVFGG